MGMLAESRDVQFEKRDLLPDELFLPPCPSSIREIIYQETRGMTPADSIFPYEDSLVLLEKKGFERHARPDEAFGILFNGFESTNFPGRGQESGFSAHSEAVYSNMLNNPLDYCEWLSMAFERKGDHLITYLDPYPVFKGGGPGYGFAYRGTGDFPISTNPSNRPLPLSQFDEKLVWHLYGRRFKDIPDDVKEWATVVIPADGECSYIARGLGPYSITCCRLAQSRGVRVKHG